ncbi:DUF3017 domain-containing protein [Corynebacterium alimapuense]|uniref:DUF3017 domain-containing protein n=1 Tax=Corynebacterium alimapuense TaxID=1576874 RepID=A0A3M8K6G2_9CORY|nr:DUF3017 domain-containing protein [Corynebacterium alimapuense]RNE48813.1 hypothetical protein C5L39_05785 [Corynebacterium alimapuense]
MSNPQSVTIGPLDNPHDRGLPASKVPRYLQRAGLVLFLAGVVFASGYALTEHWRRATLILGISLIWLTVLRMTCDSRVLGVFSVRSRRFDALFTLLIGGTMTFLAASVDALGS